MCLLGFGFPNSVGEMPVCRCSLPLILHPNCIFFDDIIDIFFSPTGVLEKLISPLQQTYQASLLQTYPSTRKLIDNQALTTVSKCPVKSNPTTNWELPFLVVTFSWMWYKFQQSGWHRRIFLWAPGTRDPYLTSIKQLLGQKNNLKDHCIIEIVNIVIQE